MNLLFSLLPYQISKYCVQMCIDEKQIKREPRLNIIKHVLLQIVKLTLVCGNLQISHVTHHKLSNSNQAVRIFNENFGELVIVIQL